MEMKKCLNGHYYDVSVNADCPYCSSEKGSSVTMPLERGSGDYDKTMPLNNVFQLNKNNDRGDKTMPLGYQQTQFQGNERRAEASEGRTVAIIRNEIGIDPVVGWLVCIDGKEKGRDYKIHSDNNFVGRSEKMDICIRGDETISRENHLIISYDTKDKIFYCSPGDGRSIVRLNDKAIFQTVQLKPYDCITVGATTLSFIPFCGEIFEWKGDDNAIR